MSFQVKSRLYLGLIGVNWSQYATYFHLGPKQGLYEEDMLEIYRDFEGKLPFTGIYFTLSQTLGVYMCFCYYDI